MSLEQSDTTSDFGRHPIEGPLHSDNRAAGNWVVALSDPKGSSLCTTKLGAVSKFKPEFDRCGAKMSGSAGDPVDSHEDWARDIEEIQGRGFKFRLTADKARKVSEQCPASTPSRPRRLR